jgi:uncharacterized membrane protein
MDRRAPGDVQGPAAIPGEPRWRTDLAVVAVGVAAYFPFVIWGHAWLIGVSLV